MNTFTIFKNIKFILIIEIGMGFDLGIWAAIIKKILITIGIMLISGLVSVVLFVKPGILMKWNKEVSTILLK